MFLSTGVSGAIGVATSSDYEYETSQEGGTENTMLEGIASGAGGYAGPNMAFTRPLSEDYAPQVMIAPINTVAPPPMPQAPNAYTDTGNAMLDTTSAQPTPTGTAPKSGDCGCGGNCGDCKTLPWYVIVGLVIGVVLLMRD